MILVFDINTIWREMPFRALSNRVAVVGVRPRDRRTPAVPGKSGELKECPVVLPPGWATVTAGISQRLLWKKALRFAGRAEPEAVSAVIVTSPHYHALLDQVSERIKTFYYASDDYRSYEKWNNMALLEKRMVQRVNHSFFISRALQERAVREYGVSEVQTSVSMNATEDRFFASGSGRSCQPPLNGISRPIAGVIGGINERLDFGLLRRCADLPELGTLLLVGALPSWRSEQLRQLLQHPKCRCVGTQPHETIHQWFQCLDVGLIPYVRSDFNRFCSPMRLFDHLASGVPLVATDACRQVSGFSANIAVCAEEPGFVQAVAAHLHHSGFSDPDPQALGIRWSDRAESLLNVMQSS